MPRNPLTILSCLAALALAGPAMAQPQGVTLQRDRLLIVAAGASEAFTSLLGSSFVERFPGAHAPTVQDVGSTRALEQFCAGIGPRTPDIAIVTRRMPRAIADACKANGVTDVIEQELGLGAVVIAVRRGDPTPNLTSRQVWEALAAERPVNEEFVTNRTANWSDINVGLPRIPIRMLVPNDDSGTRALFNELVMESGCRYVKAIRLLFEASYRHTKCVSLRQDGRAVTLLPGADIGAALLASPPGTMAVMSYDQVLASGGNFLALTLDGVLPTPATIAAQDYEQTQPLYIYAKRQHSVSNRGVSVVGGIREFLIEAASDTACGPGGYLTLAGLVPFSPATRLHQQRIAEQLTLMSR